jgi:hypothetical protein
VISDGADRGRSKTNAAAPHLGIENWPCVLIEAAAFPYPLRTARAAQARQDRRLYRPSADCLSVERPAERSPRLSDSTCSSSLARRAALTSLTSGKEHPNCRALFCTATWRRFRTTEARAGETPFWTRAKRSSMCSGVQLRRDTRTMLDYSCWLSFRAARSDRFAQSIPTRFCRSVRRRTETLRTAATPYATGVNDRTDISLAP